MLTQNRFPVGNPVLDSHEKDPRPPQFTIPLLRWFQQATANISQVPEFANESPSGSVNGTNTQFLLPTAAPNPPSSLQLYSPSGAFINPANYALSGQLINFYVAPTGSGVLFASYRY